MHEAQATGNTPNPGELRRKPQARRRPNDGLHPLHMALVFHQQWDHQKLWILYDEVLISTPTLPQALNNMAGSITNLGPPG